MGLFKKILNHKFYILYTLHSIYFNFKFLPFKQAIKLTILLYRPKFYSLNGKIEINGDVHFGMILLGCKGSLYDDFGNSCIRFNLKGGCLTFNGPARIGLNSLLEIGPKGKLRIGENFIATSSFKLFCYNEVAVGKNCSFGWDQLIMDTSFHPLIRCSSMEKEASSKPIIIGNNCWLASRCVCLPGASIPCNSVIALGSVVKKTLHKSFALYGTNTNLVVKKDGVFFDQELSKDPLVFGDFNAE